MRSGIKAWWKQAEADARTAEVNLKEKRYYASVFFCQQAAEKAVRAFVVRRKRNPRSPEMFGHSLIHRAKVCGVPQQFQSFLRDLTSEYVNTNYPSAAEEPPEALYDETVAARTVTSSREVLEWVEKHL
jgi:HEPN domain-containing protein